MLPVEGFEQRNDNDTADMFSQKHLAAMGNRQKQAGWGGGGIAVGAVTLPQFSLDPQESRHDFLRPRRTAAAAWVGAQVFSHA